MIKRITTTAILLMVVAAVGLALLVTPAEAAPRPTTPPYEVGDRYTQDPLGRGCTVVAVKDGVPEGYMQTLYIVCRDSYTSAWFHIVWIDQDGNSTVRWW